MITEVDQKDVSTDSARAELNILGISSPITHSQKIGAILKTSIGASF